MIVASLRVELDASNWTDVALPATEVTDELEPLLVFVAIVDKLEFPVVCKAEVAAPLGKGKLAAETG